MTENETAICVDVGGRCQIPATDNLVAYYIPCCVHNRPYAIAAVSVNEIAIFGNMLGTPGPHPCFFEKHPHTSWVPTTDCHDPFPLASSVGLVPELGDCRQEIYDFQLLSSL